jgi:hypothetical protein
MELSAIDILLNYLTLPAKPKLLSAYSAISRNMSVENDVYPQRSPLNFTFYLVVAKVTRNITP